MDVQRIGTVGNHTNVVVRQCTGGTASQIHLAAQLTVKVTGGVVAAEGQRLVNRSVQRTQRIADIVVSGGVAISRIARSEGVARCGDVAVAVNRAATTQILGSIGTGLEQLAAVHCIGAVGTDVTGRHIADHFVVGIQTIVVDVGVAAYLNTVATDYHLAVARTGGNAVNSEVTRQIEGDVIGTGGFADFNVVVAVVQVNGFVGTDIAAVLTLCGQIPTGTGSIAYGVQLINVHRIGTGLTFGYAGNHVTAVVKTAFRQAYRVAVGRGDVDTVAANGGAVTGGVHKLGAGQIGQLFGQLDVQRIGTVGNHTNVVVRQFTGRAAVDF